MTNLQKSYFHSQSLTWAIELRLDQEQEPSWEGNVQEAGEVEEVDEELQQQLLLLLEREQPL